MSPDAIKTPETKKFLKSRKLALMLGAAAVAIVALPLGDAFADMRGGGYGKGYGHGHGYHQRADRGDCDRGGRRGGMHRHGRHHGDMRGGFAGRMFDELDADDDGKVTKEEVAAKRAERFTAIDANGDGEVSLAEIAALEEAAREARRNLRAARRIGSARGFVAADADGNGTISADEFAAMPQRMFDRFDSDGDGAVSKDELRDRFGKGRSPRGPRSE